MIAFFKRNKTIILFLLFTAYVIFVSIKEFLTVSSAYNLSIQYLAGLISLGITAVLLFVNKKIFLIAFLLLLVASTFILEFHPYTIHAATYEINGHVFFKGKSEPLLFLIAFVSMHFNQVIHFFRHSKIWN